MDKAGFIQQTQAIEKLLGEDAHEGSTQTTELVLLNQFVQIDTKKFKHQAQMLPVNECIFQT